MGSVCVGGRIGFTTAHPHPSGAVAAVLWTPGFALPKAFVFALTSPSVLPVSAALCHSATAPFALHAPGDHDMCTCLPYWCHHRVI